MEDMGSQREEMGHQGSRHESCNWSCFQVQSLYLCASWSMESPVTIPFLKDSLCLRLIHCEIKSFLSEGATYQTADHSCGSYCRHVQNVLVFSPPSHLSLSPFLSPLYLPLLFPLITNTCFDALPHRNKCHKEK